MRILLSVKKRKIREIRGDWIMFCTSNRFTLRFVIKQKYHDN